MGEEGSSSGSGVTGEREGAGMGRGVLAPSDMVER